MQTRSAAELMSWRLKSGTKLTREQAHEIEAQRGQVGHPANVGEIQQKFLNGTADIFRLVDEPGAWRWHSNCELIAPGELGAMFDGNPQYVAELRERQLMEDRERALGVLRAVVNGNGGKVVDQRGQYALVESGAGLYMVTCSGQAMLPGPCGEAIARAVFNELAPPMVMEPEQGLAAELAA